MSDDSDPPRTFFRLKPAEFEALNRVPEPAPGDPIAFVSAIGVIGMFTAWLIWQMWFLRTD